jgi:hypothetical protein
MPQKEHRVVVPPTAVETEECLSWEIEHEEVGGFISILVNRQVAAIRRHVKAAKSACSLAVATGRESVQLCRRPIGLATDKRRRELFLTRIRTQQYQVD